MTKNRKLFEEIDERSDNTKASSVETFSIEQSSWLSIWLWTLLVSLITLILVGGWSAKCFTKSDEKWINNWSKKINNIFSLNNL